MKSDSISNHFATLSQLNSENDEKADRPFNVGEMGISSEREMVIFSLQRYLLPLLGRSATEEHRILEFTDTDRVTSMPVISAAGDLGQMVFVFKGEKLPYLMILKKRKRDHRHTCEVSPKLGTCSQAEEVWRCGL